MKRDMDLVRDLLLLIEQTAMRAIYLSDLKEAECLRQTDDFVIGCHLDLLKEAGLIQARKTQGISTVGPWVIERLTWDGHEFLDTIRDPEIWRKTKAGASTAGGWTIGLLKDLGTAYIKVRAKEILGLDL